MASWPTAAKRVLNPHLPRSRPARRLCLAALPAGAVKQLTASGAVSPAGKDGSTVAHAPRQRCPGSDLATPAVIGGVLGENGPRSPAIDSEGRGLYFPYQLISY